MKKIINRTLLCMECLIFGLCLVACKGENAAPEDANTADIQTYEEEATENPVIDEAEGNRNLDKESVEQEERKDIPEEVPETKYTYRGDTILTEENIEQTMETFLCIKSEDELYLLEELPLTEDFFNKSIEDFPYIENIENIKIFDLDFWGIREDGKCVCLCEFNRDARGSAHPMSDFYYVVMDLEDDKIASMEMTLVEKYKPKY